MTVPEDNSHLPVTVGPNEPVSWWRTKRSGVKVIETLSLDQLALDDTRHRVVQVSVDLSPHSSRVWFTVKCSCGWEYRTYESATGRFGRGSVDRWRAHVDTLISKVFVWESGTRGENGRVSYKCYVGTQDHRKQDIGDIGRGGGRFVAYLVATSGKHARIGSAWALADAINAARQEGVRKERQGFPITWHENGAIEKPEGEAASVLTKMANAQTSQELYEALKLADDFLSCAEIVKTHREDLVKRLQIPT